MSPANTFLESGTSTHRGAIIGIGMVTNATFTTITGLAGDSLSGVTFPAGFTLLGNYTVVTPASGTVVIYYGGLGA